jgi:RNA polymerase sigma factor (TIGR02999 family)
MARPDDLLATGRPGDAVDVTSTEQLSPLLYAELKALAARAMRRERNGHTLQTTALVHEAWMRVAGQHQLDLGNREQVLSIAARMMRRVLVDHARRRLAAKRTLLDEPQCMPGIALGVDPADAAVVTDLIALDRALARLEALSPRQAQVVDLKFFAGLELEDIATTLNVARATIVRDWRMARAWLQRELSRV